MKHNAKKTNNDLAAEVLRFLSAEMRRRKDSGLPWTDPYIQEVISAHRAFDELNHRRKVAEAAALFVRRSE